MIFYWFLYFYAFFYRKSCKLILLLNKLLKIKVIEVSKNKLTKEKDDLPIGIEYFYGKGKSKMQTNSNNPFILIIDSSTVAIGAVRFQINNQGKECIKFFCFKIFKNRIKKL